MNPNTGPRALEGKFNAIGGNRFPLVVLSLVIAAVGGVWVWKSPPRNDVHLPDEKAVAMELLEAKLSGPRYFKTSAAATSDSGGPWIDLQDARLQEERVMMERRWGQSQRAELEELMSRLSEPIPARMVGGYRIPLERLNLALDAIKNHEPSG